MLPAAEWFRILLGNQPKWEIQPWWRQRYKMDSLLQWACRVSAQSYGNWLISQKSKTHPQLGSWIHPNIWTTKMTNLQRRIALHCSMKLDSLGRAAAQAIQTLSVIKVNCGQNTITSLWNTRSSVKIATSQEVQAHPSAQYVGVSQRQHYEKGKLAEDCIAKLNAIGFLGGWDCWKRNSYLASGMALWKCHNHCAVWVQVYLSQMT